MSEKQRDRGWMIKQRAFLKLYLITEIEKGQTYGLALLDILQGRFKQYAFEPFHTEVYRCLHELAEEGILRKGEELIEGAKYKKVAVYTIKDKGLAKAYKELVKKDLDRCEGLLRQAIRDNYA